MSAKFDETEINQHFAKFGTRVPARNTMRNTMRDLHLGDTMIVGITHKTHIYAYTQSPSGMPPKLILTLSLTRRRSAEMSMPTSCESKEGGGSGV